MAERQESDGRQRREMAQAFQEFRAANPEASFAEFQSFIDQMSGGRNYLRGGAPGRDVLQGIAAENQTRKAERLSRERLADARAKAEFRGQLEAQIDDALLGMEGDDFGGAVTRFTESLGGDLGGLDISGMFTPARRQRAIMGQLAQTWPTLSGLIADTQGDVDAKTLAQMSGVPLAVAEAAVKKHQTATERETQTYLQRNRATLIDAAVDALNNGLDPVAAAEAIAGEQGIQLPKDFAGSLTAEAERRRTQADEDRKRQQRAEMMRERQQALAFVIERAEKGQDIRPLIADFFDVDPATMPEDVVSGMIDSFNREKEKREAEEKRAIEDRVSTHQLNLETRVAEHQAITAALALGNTTQAEQQVARLIAAMPSDVRDNLPVDYAQQLVAERLAQMQAAQDAQIEERRLTTQQSAIEAGANIDDDSLKYATDQARSMSSPLHANAMMVLANQFVIDPRAQGVLMDAFAKADASGTSTDLQEVGARALAAAGIPTIEQARANERDKVMRAAGAVEQDMTFDQYITTMRGDVDELRDGAMALIDRASKTKDPEQAMRLLEQAQGALIGGSQQITDTIKLDQRNSRQILTVGTPGWDQRRVEADVLGSLQRAQSQIERKLGQTRAIIEKKAAEQEAQRAAQMAPTAPTAPSAEKSQVGRVVGERQDFVALRNRVADLANPYVTGVFHRFADPESEYVEKVQTFEFLRDRVTLDRLTKDPSLIDAIEAHPGGAPGWIADNKDVDWVAAVLKRATS